VDIEKARQLLDKLRPNHAGIESEVGLRNQQAYLRIHDSANPDRWAAVYTSGWTYSTVEVDGEAVGVEGRFSLDYFHEGVPDFEVEARLRDYVDLGIEYLLSGGTVVRSQWLRIPRILVGPVGAQNALSTSLAHDLRDLFRPTHWRSR
jgi:hypothetical protein